MLSPASIKGLKYTHDNAGGNISYLGLNIPTEKIDGGILKQIALSALSVYNDTLPLSKTKEGYAANISGVTLNFDELGFITSLKANNTTVNFEHKKTD